MKKDNIVKCEYCSFRQKILQRDERGRTISILEYDSYSRSRYRYPSDCGMYSYFYTNFEYTTGD